MCNLSEGIRDAQREEMAIKLLKRGDSPESVSEITELSLSRIMELNTQIKTRKL